MVSDIVLCIKESTMERSNDIFIKGMVCGRCISLIRHGIIEMGYQIDKVSLGKVSLISHIGSEDRVRIEQFLSLSGFEVISDRYSRLIKKVKEIIQEVFNENVKYERKLRFSALLSELLHMSYDSISETFSKYEGETLEQYIINRRLDKVKELLMYTEFTLTEIAYLTGFSSLTHLSRQFKEHNGLSPSHFKSLRSTKDKLTSADKDIDQ